MPPKKKRAPPKNAFYFYMVEFRAKKESQGVKFPGGFKDVAEAASPSWKGLDPTTKRHYENMAERAKVSGSGGVRYTTHGQTYDEVDRERREQEQKKALMLHTIQMEVESGGRLGLKTHRFYFIHVNHYGAMEDHRYVPCEVALLAYSIEEGFQIGNLYHEFIANMEIPSGYTFKAMTVRDSTHKCPLPPKAMGTMNHQRVYENIIGLIEKNGDLDEGRPPPIYTMARCILAVEDFFLKGNQFLHNIHHVTRIYPLEQLFFRMKNFGVKPEGQRLFFNGVEDKGFPFLTNAEDIIRGDMYDFAPGIACQYHEEEDVRQHCSRSYVIRWGFMLSDHLCANLDVKIVSERHTPRGTNLTAINITSEMEHLRLRNAGEAPREFCGRGKPVDGRSVPTSRSNYSSMKREPWSGSESSYSRSSSRASNVRQNDKPFTIIDHSKFLDDDHNPLPGAPCLAVPQPLAVPVSMPVTMPVTMPDTIPVSEEAPLRAPKSRGKSSLLLNAMNAGSGAAKGPLGGVGRGRGALRNN